MMQATKNACPSDLVANRSRTTSAWDDHSRAQVYQAQGRSVVCLCCIALPIRQEFP